MSKSSSGSDQHNRANQLNPNNPAYQGSRQGSGNSKPAVDNRSNQLNPNHARTKPDHGAADAEELAEEFGGSSD